MITKNMEDKIEELKNYFDKTLLRQEIPLTCTSCFSFCEKPFSTFRS